ncbi:hypothetical protein MKW92_021934 [Papaver armeniacum]|nr:hypothetical protein MKW92_021934 [Papaver armeniacum]
MGGVRASINCFLKGFRGKEDVQIRMAAGFGVGFTLKLMLTPMWVPDVAVKAVIHGVIGALVGGSGFQLGHRISPPSREYTRTRCMLSNLGLQNYEKNFQEGFLIDTTFYPCLPIVFLESWESLLDQGF